jgi:hypothetical protein
VGAELPDALEHSADFPASQSTLHVPPLSLWAVQLDAKAAFPRNPKRAMIATPIRNPIGAPLQLLEEFPELAGC